MSQFNDNKAGMNLWLTEYSNDNFGISLKVKNILFSKRSDYQQIDIVETDGYGRVLLNDGILMISERDEFIYHEMMAHVPLFLHNTPKRILVVGGGDGGTVREVLKHPEVELCYLVEIDEVVVEGCKEFIPLTASSLDDKRVKVIMEDAVKFISETGDKFDVIMVDSTDPVGPGAPLFGESFYSDVFKALNDGGIVVSQAESPFIYSRMQKKLFDILKSIFPYAGIYNFVNMTYPGGLWSFSIASKDKDFNPLKINRNKYEKLGLKLKYYNDAVHVSAFSIPEFQKEFLYGDVGER